MKKITKKKKLLNTLLLTLMVLGIVLMIVNYFNIKNSSYESKQDLIKKYEEKTQTYDKEKERKIINNYEKKMKSEMTNLLSVQKIKLRKDIQKYKTNVDIFVDESLGFFNSIVLAGKGIWDFIKHPINKNNRNDVKEHVQKIYDKNMFTENDIKVLVNQNANELKLKINEIIKSNIENMSMELLNIPNYEEKDLATILKDKFNLNISLDKNLKQNLESRVILGNSLGITSFIGTNFILDKLIGKVISGVVKKVLANASTKIVSGISSITTVGISILVSIILDKVINKASKDNLKEDLYNKVDDIAYSVSNEFYNSLEPKLLEIF
ncbi:MAG: hypothetical protein PWP28_2645 [Oceanotoga sp.]|jgi:DNA-binding cell septation regulator SpoVG|uniref:hypothetical protein n=1 Tax=Oceanotoga sp. TaxID=2108366 RepID=UPI0026564877|nr:hypothetical protein [Oceanotoga sp.]MDN5343764.1 hypothetical protein [Oceanotoga sp.]